MPYPTKNPAAAYVRLLSHYASVNFNFVGEYGLIGADPGTVSLPVEFRDSEDMVAFLDDLAAVIEDKNKYPDALIIGFENGGFAAWTVITDSGNEYPVRLDLYVDSAV